MILLAIKAIVLGLVEGVTEFLPVSSTGHLIILNQFFTFSPEFTALFDIVIQLGAILSVLYFFRKKLWSWSSDAEKNKITLDIWYKTIVGVIPAIILGALFGSLIQKKLFNPWVVAAALIVGGVILIAVERKKSRTVKINSVSEMSYLTAFYIGLIQCISFIPGTSRSAATIIGAILLGSSRVAATEFSFFLAIPTMIVASGYSLLKHGFKMTGTEAFILAIGFAVSFVTALFVIRKFIGYIQKKDFKPFGYYRIILGVAVIIFFLFA